MEELEFPSPIDSCPKEDNPDWLHSSIGEIENLYPELPFALPEIQEDEFGECMIGFTGGPYKLRMAHHYVTLCQRVEMEKKTKENDGNYFRNHEAFTQACTEFPKDMILHLKHFESFGDAWMEDMLGPFPRSGVIAVYARDLIINEAGQKVFLGIFLGKKQRFHFHKSRGKYVNKIKIKVFRSKSFTILMRSLI